MIIRLLLTVAVLASGLSFAAAPDAKPKPVTVAVEQGWPKPEMVRAAMLKAVATMRRNVSFAGGYAWHWPQDLSIAHGENHSSPSLIMMQPPGTPAVGLAFLHAYRATGDKLALQAAKEAAQSLMWCQMATGGWDSDFDFDLRKASHYHYRRDIIAGDTDPAGRHGSSTLDDDKTQSCLLFLLELAHTEACKDDKELRAALDFGLDGLLAAQAPNGGWPQHYRGPADPKLSVTKAKIPAEWPHVWPAVDYTGFYTLNDNNIEMVIELLLRAYELENNERYLKAATKAGEFLLLGILPDPQPVWAQQYNAAMEPVWARKFEPPAACTIESLGALKALFELWLVTQDKRWLSPMDKALAWFDQVRMKDGKWARFYELGTNKPIYCKAKTYELTYDDSDLPTHYGFKEGEQFKANLDKFRQLLTMSREDVLKKRELPQTPRKWASLAKNVVPKVQNALSTQAKKGWWIEGEDISADLCVRHVNAMASYLEGADKGGEEFTKLFEANKPAVIEKPASKPAAKP